MFNLKRQGRYLLGILAVLTPILSLLFILGLALELRSGAGGWEVAYRSRQFWLAIARNMVPGMLALLFVHVLVARFVQAVYGLASFSLARGFVYRCLFGLRSFGPWLRVTRGAAEANKEHILLHVGGPGHLVIYNDSAVLLERAGRFSRTSQAGFLELKPFEKVYATLDLRPKHWIYPVSALSQEGIPIVCEADITYQIENEADQPKQEEPYPVSEQTIFQAATSTWIREENRPEETRIMDWSGRVIISETEGALRNILARYPLNRVIGLIGAELSPREDIRLELETRLKAAVPKLGARIIKVELGDIKVRDEISQQWINAWQANWERWVTERRTLGSEQLIEPAESPRNRAQALMLNTIADALQPLITEGRPISAELVLAQLVAVLTKAAADPVTLRYLPPETIRALKQLGGATAN